MNSCLSCYSSRKDKKLSDTEQNILGERAVKKQFSVSIITIICFSVRLLLRDGKNEFLRYFYSKILLFKAPFKAKAKEVMQKN